MPPYRKIRGILFYRCAFVCLSVCLSVCLHKLNMKTQHFPITLKLIYLQGSYLVWRHISSICICWYQSQGHLQRSRSNTKVTFPKKLPFRGHSCFTKLFILERVNLLVFGELIKCSNFSGILQLALLDSCKVSDCIDRMSDPPDGSLQELRTRASWFKPFPHNDTFWHPWKQAFWKHRGKRRNCS